MARRGSVRIDMTPMVDVAFLLLIFFMSTTQFKPPEAVAVNLPASTADVRVPETGTIIVTLNREGRIFISSERGTDIQEVPKDQALAAIINWRSRNPGAVVILKGDREAPFGEISDLMNTLADAKTLRFNLMTDIKRRAPGADSPAPAPSEAPQAPSAPPAPDAPGSDARAGGGA